MSVRKNVYRSGTIVWMVVRALVRKFRQDNGLFLASGLAFSLLLYLIPLVLIMISVLGYTVLESEQAMKEVQSVFRQFLPRSQQAIAENVAAIVADRGLLGIVGFISFLLFSTMVFGSTRHVLNTVFQAGPPRSFLRGTAHDLLMMVFCVVLLVVMISLASVAAVTGDLGAIAPWAGLWGGQGIRMFHWATGVILGGSLILGLYWFSPVKRLKFKSLAVGTGVAVALFWLAKQGFAWYVQFAQASIPLYGALGAFLFFFVWLYYASVVFVLGAEASWVFEHRETLERTVNMER